MAHRRPSRAREAFLPHRRLNEAAGAATMTTRVASGEDDPPRSDRGYLAVAGLVALSAVPMLAGILRLSRLATGTVASAADIRFFASPTPVTIHILAVSLYCLLGAWQFAPAWRRGHPRWHRRAGVALIASGLLAAGTGLWMNQVYARISTDSAALYGMRVAVGLGMAAAILMAVAAVRKGDGSAHGAWMIRAYALGQGAGTQVLTFLPWVIVAGEPGPAMRAVLMGAAWVINIAVAEGIIRRGRARRRVLLDDRSSGPC